MNSFPRRSPRFQPPVQQPQPSIAPSFPSFSNNSSTVSTSHPSPTNNVLNQPQQYPLHFQSQYLSTGQSDLEAPLPSPSATDLDLDSYMTGTPSHSNHHMMSGQSQQSQNSTNSYQNNTTQTQTVQTQNNQHQQHHHSSFSQPQRPNYPPTSVNGVPPGLPPDFLAEAAKRAQMACLMRDLGDVSL